MRGVVQQIDGVTPYRGVSAYVLLSVMIAMPVCDVFVEVVGSESNTPCSERMQACLLPLFGEQTWLGPHSARGGWGGCLWICVQARQLLCLQGG